ncbi:hypothetical protein [Fictibacillus sp. NRS-1165]|uniref:hypothetical protein n=1 Tax=Fictibacillus sp. NRS-1165 TaxID=3144463 RepID=UPI003D216F9C
MSLKTIIISSIILIILIISNLSFLSRYNEQKKETAAVKQELREVKKKLEAERGNKEDVLIQLGEAYTKHLFVSGRKQERLEWLQKQSTPRLNGKRLRDMKKQHDEDSEGSRDLVSKITIKKSIYNQTAADRAQVIVTFAHQYQSGREKETTINKITYQIKYIKGKWLVDQFDITQEV